MSSQVQVELPAIVNEECVFWSGGNRPTQILHHLSTREELLHLKALYLLTDRVLAAASFYFESSITRKVTHTLKPLFERGEILYFVDSSIENFAEHGAVKSEKSPANFRSYQDKQLVADRAKHIDSLGYVLRRPSYSISDKIIELWNRDVMSSDYGTLGRHLDFFFTNRDERTEIALKLTNLGNLRGSKDFVWEYVGPRLKQMQLPKIFRDTCRRRLSQMYAVATSDLLGVFVDRSTLSTLSPFVTANSRYDSSLFLDCMQILGVHRSFEMLNPPELMVLKNTPEFVYFREFYFKLIDAVREPPQRVKDWLQIYVDHALTFPSSGVTIERFLHTFRLWCQALGKVARSYSKPLEALLYRYEMTRRSTVADFIEKLQELEQTSGVKDLNRWLSAKKELKERIPLSGQTNIILIRDLTMGDRYEIGQAGAVGPGATAHDIKFNPIWNETAEGIELPRLASELSILLSALKSQQNGEQGQAAISAISEAELAAREGDGPKAMRYLSSAGRWVLDIATNVGVPVASDALRKACDFGSS